MAASSDGIKGLLFSLLLFFCFFVFAYFLLIFFDVTKHLHSAIVI